MTRELSVVRVFVEAIDVAEQPVGMGVPRERANGQCFLALEMAWWRIPTRDSPFFTTHVRNVQTVWGLACLETFS